VEFALTHHIVKVWETADLGVPGRAIDTTNAVKADIAQGTGGPKPSFSSPINVPNVPPKELEWTLHVKSERERARRRRITDRKINRAVRAVRYGK